MEIVGLSGKAGSGKDFVGQSILHPAGYRQFAFAWPLKTTLVGRGFSYADVMHNKPPAVRRALQIVGTEEGRNVYGERLWINQAAAWLNIMEDHYGFDRFYFSDVRFPNEGDFIKELGGKMVRLELGDRPPRLTGEAAQHVTETAMDDYDGFDVTIVNRLGVMAGTIQSILAVNGIDVGLPSQAPKHA